MKENITSHTNDYQCGHVHVLVVNVNKYTATAALIIDWQHCIHGCCSPNVDTKENLESLTEIMADGSNS